MARRDRSFFFDNKTGKLKSNGKTIIDATNTTNLINVEGSTTGNPVNISAIGDDTNVDIRLSAKGAGNIEILSTLEILTNKRITDSAGTNVEFGDNIEMNSNKITGVGTPTASTDAATKGYVDGQVSTANDATITITASTGLTGSGAFTTDQSADETITLSIDSTVATLTGTQTLTNKTLTTPVISSISNTGTLTLPTSTDTLVGRATTDTLTNKSISGGDNTLTNIPNSALSNNSITVARQGGNSTAIALGGTITFNNVANETTVAESSGTITIGLANDVTIPDLTVSGNLTVSGTTTTLSTTNSVVSDSLIELNNGASSNSNDLGIVMERGSTGDNAIFMWDESADKFVVGTTTATGASTGNLSVTTGTLVANIEGNVTGDVTGNADTATALATARNIAGNSFDGSGDITIASTDLSNASSIVLVSGNTMTGNLDFNDSVRARFGTGADMSIFHNGTNSFIYNNTGALQITNFANDQDVVIRSDDGSGGDADYIRADGSTTSVKLYYGGTEVFETTSTGAKITNTSTSDALLITTTEDSSSAGPVIALKRNSGSPAPADYIGQIKFQGENDADQEVMYVQITGKIGDETDGTEDGILEITHKKAGSNNIGIRITSTEFKIMNGMDFDVETHDGSSNGLRLANTLVTATAAEINRLDGIGSAAVGTTDTQTLTNKTLTTPVISSISNTGTLTLPTSTGTVALTSDIPTNNNALTNGAGYITGYTVTESDVTTHQAALSITESQISDLGTYLTASDITGKLNLSGGTMTGAIAMGTNKITGLGDPTAAQDAATKSYVDSNVSSANDATITLTAGTGLSGGGNFTTDQSSNETITFNLDFSELTDMTGDIAGTTEFILQDGTTESRKAASEIKLSNFNNDSGFTTNAGTVTSVGGTGTVNGLTLSGTVTSSGSLTLGGTLSITESQISDFGTYLTSVALNDVSDVTISSLSSGQILKYNGTAWVNATDSGGIALTDLSVTTASAGTAALSYNNSSGVFTFTPPDLSSYITDYTVTESDVTTHQAALSITESQISDLGSYITASSSDTLTNKTLTSPSINTQIDLLARAEARFQDTSGGQYVALKAPATVSTSVTFTLPDSDGTNGQVLTTDGSGTLSFADGGAGGGNAFTTISVSGQSDVVADSSTDTLTLSNSGLVVITTTAGTDTIDIGTPSTAALPFTLADGSTSNIDLYTSGKINSVFTNLYVPFTLASGSAVTTMVVGGS